MAPRKNNRKNTRKGKTAQKQFQLRRPKAKVARSLQPILETKKYVGYLAGAVPGPVSSYMSLTSPTHVYVPGAFCYMKDDATGLSAGVEGNDIFSRYLQMKFRVTYPASVGMPASKQVQPVELIWGWCKPLNLTTLTTPIRETVNRNDIVLHVQNQIAEEFNEKLDNMKFNDRVRRNYNIIGRKKLFPNANKNIIQNSWVPDLPTGFQQKGGATPIFRNVNWKMNKKVELSTSLDTTGTGDAFMYPNQAYIPFVLLHNPSHAEYTANPVYPAEGPISQIEVTRNSCHWFNDA